MIEGGGIGVGPGGRVVHVASESEIQNLPIIKFSPGVLAPDDDRCAICLDDYIIGSELRILSCSHHFHVVLFF